MRCTIYKTQTLVFFLSFCFSFSNAQTKFDAGKVLADPNFNCEKNSGILLDPSVGKLNRICDSKNQLEIRLISAYMPHGDADIVILFFNDGKWGANKYGMSRGFIGDKLVYTELIQNPDFKKLDDSNFNLVFDSLKANNIFLLPDQGDLNLERHVFDGNLYRIVFKVNNDYREYDFNNPKSYMIDNKGIPELSQYAQIVQYMNSIFS